MKNLLSKLTPSEFINLILLLILGVFIFVNNRMSSEIEIKDSQLRAFSDTLTQYKTKDNKNAAYISVLSGSHKELQELLKKKDPTSAEILKKTKGITSLTNLTTETTVDTIVRIDTVLITDQNNNPINPDSIDYKANKFINNSYYNANIKVNNDSISLNLKVFNNFRIITRNKSNGFLKPKSLVVEVINDNPYTVTTGLNRYEVVQPKKHLGIKIGSVALAAGAAYLLLK